MLKCYRVIVRMAKSRKFKGYAVVMRGSLVWGTMKPTREQALAEFQRHNPTVDGQGHDEEIKQFTLFLADDQ